MDINFKCLYCGAKNKTTDMLIEEYVECERCSGLHDIEINDENEVVVVEF